MELNQLWQLDREMTLPDWCFGRRYWIGAEVSDAEGAGEYQISDQELPDWFVVWGILLSCRSVGCKEAIRFTIRLSITMPTSWLLLNACELMLKSIGTQTWRHEFNIQQNKMVWINEERQIIESKGRRLVFRAEGDGVHAYNINVGVQISALTKEVPEWLISGRVSALL